MTTFHLRFVDFPFKNLLFHLRFGNVFHLRFGDCPLKCDSLIVDFESGRDKSKVVDSRRSERLKAQQFYGMLAALVTVSSAVMPIEGLISLPGEDVEAIVRYLHNKQGLDGDPLEYVIRCSGVYFIYI